MILTQMTIGIIGINHKSAPLAIFENVMAHCLRHFNPKVFPLHLPHYVLVSTCNRCEIYFVSDEPAHTHATILNLMRGGERGGFEPYLYSFFGKDCFMHLSKVTAGLDSRLIGESEIQGQVKRCYLEFSSKRPLPHALHYLFQKSLKNGKGIRSRFPYPHAMPTLEGEVAERVLDFSATPSVLLMGASALQRTLYRRLKKCPAIQLHLVTRDPERAATYFDCPILNWDDMDISSYDAVIAATNFRPHIHVKTPFQTLFIDLSFPRVFDPAFFCDSRSQLVTLAEIQSAVAKKRALHFDEVNHRMRYIEQKVTLQMERLYAENLSLSSFATHSL